MKNTQFSKKLEISVDSSKNRGPDKNLAIGLTQVKISFISFYNLIIYIHNLLADLHSKIVIVGYGMTALTKSCRKV